MKIKKWLTTFLRWLNILVIVTTLLSYFAAYISPETFWLMPLLGLLYPVFLVLNILFLLAFAYLKNKAVILNLACILLGWNYLVVLYASNPASTAPVNSNQLTICTYNTQGLGIYTNAAKGLSGKEKFEPYQNLFNSLNASVYCFQENSYKNKELDEFMANHAPFAYKGYLSIYSKYPIIDKGNIIAEGNGSNGAIFTDIKIDTAIIRIYSVHLASTGVAPEAQKIADEGGNLEKEATKQSLRKIAGGLKRASLKRAKQVEQLAAHMENCPYPFLVCGDFNDTPFSYTYTTLREGLKDSFVERGNGFGVTYNGPIPGLRIDYVLGSPSFQFNTHEVVHSSLSDHYPLLCNISF